MPLYDFECESCGHVHEDITDSSVQVVECPGCAGRARKIISISGVNAANEGAEWLKSVLEVVDKEGGGHCQEFLKNPTRTNYKNWMKGEGLRPFERGERIKPEPVNTERIIDQLAKRSQERMAITIR